MRYGPRLLAEWLDTDLVTLVGLEPTERGGLRLPPDDRSPNPGWREFERDGTPVGWYADRNPRQIGIYPYASPRGRVAPAQAASPLEELAPRESLRTRQTPTPVPIGRAWVADAAVTPGISPLPADLAAPTRKPDRPFVEVVPRLDALGLAAGRRGWCWGLADEERRLTPATAYAFTREPLLEGQGLAMPMPDVNNATAPFLYYAVTSAEGSARTGRVQGFVDLRRAFDPVIYFAGPFNDEGRKPPDRNQTGVGRLPAPAVGNDKPGSRGRSWVHAERGAAHRAIQKMRIRFYLQVRTPRGESLVGIASREVRVENEREGRVFRFYPPRNFPRDWQYSIWCLIQPLDEGVATWYRVGTARRAGGAAFFFDGDRQAPEAVGIWGYIENNPSGIEHRLYQQDPPDPTDPDADGTVIPAPDATSSPDEPFGYGVPQIATGYYKFSNSEAVEGYPGEGPVSDSAPVVRVLPGETVRLRPAEKLALIRNAEGSERRPNGLPDGWRFRQIGGAGEATAAIDDGVLTIRAAANVAPENYFAIGIGNRFVLPEGEDTDLVVVGTFDQTRDPTVGISQAVVRFFQDGEAEDDGTDAVLIDRKNQPMTIDSAGTKTLLPRGRRYGPAGAAIPAGSVEARVYVKASAAGLAWNQILGVRDVQAWALGSALRKAEEIAPDGDDTEAPANFDVESSATPYPRGSTWYLGPAPTVEGVSESDIVGVTPDAVIDFRGTVPGGALPAGLGTLVSSGAATVALQADPTAPTGKRMRLLISDTSTNNRTRRQWWRGYGSRTSGASRLLGRVPPAGQGVPTRDAVELLRWLDAAGATLATLRLTSAGNITVHRLTANGSVAESRIVLSGLDSGDLFDVELAVSGGNSREGVIRASAGRNGPRTSTETFTGLDWRGRLVRDRYIGGYETSAPAKWALWLYSIVDTPAGDVLYRENPPAPSGYVSPDPDAPPKAAGGFVLVDANGDKINQWWGVIEPGAGVGRGYGPTTRRPIVVIPGQTYTTAARGRHKLVETERYGETYEYPAHQFFVTLTKAGGADPLYVGSPYGPGVDAAAVSRAGTTNTAGVGMALEENWLTLDRWQRFTVPPGYCEAHVGPLNDFPGVYVFQPHNFFKGNLSPGAFGGDADAAQAARDALRAYGALDTGTFDVKIDSRLEAVEFTPEPGRVQRQIDFGADHGAADLAPIAITARSSSAPAGAPFSAATANKAAVPELPVVRVSGTLSAIAGERPEIPPGAVYLETRPAVSVLLDEHERPFLGMVLAGDAEDFARADENEEPVDGHAFSVRQSDLVDRLTPMALIGFTKEAGRALREITANTVLHYQDPFGGDDGLGRSYRIRFYARLDVEGRALPVRVFGGIARSAAVVTATPEAEILEEAVLGPWRFA